ncbi:uncharacterized protein LOC111395991 [Olea europaea var. sylvestris]|uniref:uncharacterized protein LOC111395991 n=1 Tax=Olea europaea var. sylvestris TaxID=158386 RepID=UPI000C1D4209|nr:uncharacterized protein LOC111395991 [Olea europaea var. sylvestris]
MGKKKRVPSSSYSGPAPPLPLAVRQDVLAGGIDTSLKSNLMENNKVILPSPSVSLTLGANDTESENSDFESNMVVSKENKTVNGAGIGDGKDNKAPWVNLFKDNRKMEDNIKLKPFHNQSDEVVLGDLDEDNIENSWGYGLVGYFAGRFPGKVALLHMCDSWKVNYKYFVHSSGWLVFKFETDVDRLSVLHGGPHLVYGRPLILKVMPRYFDFNDKDVSTMPVWINLPGLPLEFWNTNALGKIVSKVGKPISTDKVTASRGRLSYARALVEVDASIELVRVVKIRLPNGSLREQDILFEHEPKFCGSCKVFGHSSLGCKYNKNTAGGETSKSSELAGKGQNTQAGNCSNFQQPPAETGSESCEKSAENVDGQNRELNRLQGQPTLQPNNDGVDGQETQAEVQADGPFIEVVNRKNEAGRRKNSTHVHRPQVSTIQGCHMRNLKADSSSTMTGSFSKNVTNEKLKDIADEVRRARKLSEKKKGISLASSS